MGKVVLMTGNGLVEGLAVGVTGEVEGLAPAVLVQIGGQVVVVPGEGGIFVTSFLRTRSIAVTAIWPHTFRVPFVSPQSRRQRPCCPSA